MIWANEMNLKSRTELFVNFKRAELELKKIFVSNSSRVLSWTNSYRVELGRVRFDSTHFQPYHCIFSLGPHWSGGTQHIRKSMKAWTIWSTAIWGTSEGLLGMSSTNPYCLFTRSSKWRYTICFPQRIHPEYGNISWNGRTDLRSSYVQNLTSSTSKRSSAVR